MKCKFYKTFWSLEKRNIGKIITLTEVYLAHGNSRHTLVDLVLPIQKLKPES